MEEVINYFKYRNLYKEDLFNDLNENSLIIDKPYNEIKDFVGCYYMDGKYKLILPKIQNTEDILIWIHEYSHALFPNETSEVFPNIMEADYITHFIKDEEEKKRILDIIEKQVMNTDIREQSFAKMVKLKSIK